MKGIMKKIIAITLLIQIVVAGFAFAPSSYATETNISSGNVTTGAVGDNPTPTPFVPDFNEIFNAVNNVVEITEPTPTPFVPNFNEIYNTTNSIVESTENVNTGDGSNDIFSKVLDGLAGILVLPVKIMPLIVGKVLTWLMNAVAGEGIIGTLSVADILFNNVTLTGINFFELNSGDDTVDQIRKSVSIWYYSIRNLSAILLIVIIVYVGIRMALSTIAEDKAKYKQMLIDWITGLALLFVLHYIMVAIVNINNILVDVLKSTITGSNGQISDTIMNQLFSDALVGGFTRGLGSALCYALLVGVTFLFLLSYVKRMVTIAFLIVIAPLVTVTYSIDKMGDSKSQALNTWLKEFSYNILIQPFQCVTYLALGQTAVEILNNTYTINPVAAIKPTIIAIFMLIFILTSEKIIKHIFHFESKSMSDTLAAAVGGATLISLANKARSGGGGKGGSSGGENSGNKFADPQKSMTTPKANATNVRQGGNPNRPSSGSSSTSGSGVGANGGTGGGGTAGSGTGTGAGAAGGTPSGAGAKGSKGGALVRAGKRAGKWWLKTGVKVGSYATGAMLGLGATGSIDKGMIQGGALAGGAMAKRIQKSETNKKRRNLAKAYNNYARSLAPQQDEELTPEQINQINTQVRQKAVDILQGNVQGPLTDDEKELQAALKEMSSTYEKRGMSEEERNEALNNDFNGIETGAISETSASMRFVGSVKRTASRVNNSRRNGRWGFGGKGSSSQQGQRNKSKSQPRQKSQPKSRKNSSGGSNSGGSNT